MILRADEEVQLLQTEMKAVISFFQDDWQKISCAVEQLKLLPGSKYNNGALHRLQLQRLTCESFLTDLTSTLFQFTNLPPLPVEKFLSSALSYPHKRDAAKFTVSHDLPQGNVMWCVACTVQNVISLHVFVDDPDTGTLPHTEVYSDDDETCSDEEFGDSENENGNNYCGVHVYTSL